MKNLIKLFVFILVVTGYTFTQEQPGKIKEIIITPDGKLMSRIDGSITESNYNLNTLKNNKQENDAPIGTSFSWDSNLNFYAGSVDWTVSAIAVSGSDVYIGGNFTDAVGHPNGDHIIRYNQKTNTWYPVGTGLNGNVHSIAISGNEVYVGGDFTDAGGNSNADHIARWDGNNWNALGIGLTNTVYAIAIQGSNVYVGGSFTSAGGNFESDYIARWDGINWNSMGQLDDYVFAIAVNGTYVFVGGAFTSASSAGFNYFASYDGSLWGSLGTPLNGEVRAISISGSDLYIGGAFTNAGGNINADAVAHFDLNTYSGWQSLGNGIIKYDWYPNSIVTSLASNGKDLYVGGPFWSPYNSYFKSVAYWNGTTWDSLDTGLFGACRALALSGTDLFAGGDGFGFARWFGAYASGIYGGVQNPLTDPTGLVEFNTLSDSTAIRIELNSGSGSTGIFNVLCYEDKILDGTILPVANHRWIIQQTGLPYYSVNGNIRFKIVDLPDSSGILYPGNGSLGIFQRSTPGRGQFNDLTPWTWYDVSTGEYVVPFTDLGEYAIGMRGSVDGVIDPGEYGSHVQGENMLTSDGKTWYMKSDNYYLYFGISNYADSSEAVNFYLDNSGISPVNFPSDGYGTIIGSREEGNTPNLSFRAEFFAYSKPAYDEYKYTDYSGGWGGIDSVTNSFIKAYSDPNNVFEFAIPLSSLPVSMNQYNNPLSFFNWLGFISKSGTISSRVPSNTNPSGISNDLVWYFESSIYSYPFQYNSYTHIGPSLPNMGNFNCYDFTYYSPGTTIDRTSGVWNIEGDFFVYAGTLTFQNSDSVNIGAFLTAGGTTNFSYGSNDAPLNIKYDLWQWELGGTINMNSGHLLTYITPQYSSGGYFRGREVLQNVVVNNPNDVFLGADMIISQSLTLLNGNIQTITYDTFYVILNQDAIIGGTGYIEGSLVKYVDLAPSPNGGDSPDNLVVNFPVGTANGSSPVSVDFSNVSTAGKLTVQAFQNVHPNTTNPSETLGRYWRITKDNNLAFTSANITFNYRPEDFNGTSFSEATDEATMVVGKYDAANWSYPSIFTRTPGGINDGGSITISGVTSFSDFTMAKSEAALPVELKSFTAVFLSSSVKLNWTTATEVNNFGFEIERTIHSSTPLSMAKWEKIGFVEGSGNSNSIKEYSFTDTELIGGSKFTYRLKQINNDGTFSYSDEINFEVVPNKFELSQNYPNPFNPGTRIRYSIPNVGSGLAQIVLKVYDVLGNEVATLVNEEKSAGSYEVDFNSSQLSSGIYFYKLQAGLFSETKKMTLLR